LSLPPGMVLLDSAAASTLLLPLEA